MFLFHTSLYVFLYGKNQQILVFSKQKMANTNRKGARNFAKLPEENLKTLRVSMLPSLPLSRQLPYKDTDVPKTMYWS